MKTCLALLMLLSGASALLCNLTVGPGDDWDTDVSNYLSSISISDTATICVQAGTIAGCGNGVAGVTGGGGNVRFVGLGPSRPTISCVSGGRAFKINNVAATAHIEHLKIANGDEQSVDQSGGGATAESGTITLVDVEFESCSSSALLVKSGDVTVDSCVFTSNDAGGALVLNDPNDPGSDTGGAIRMTGGSLTVTNSTFYANSAAHGGAIHVGGGGSLTVQGSVFELNVDVNLGGAAVSWRNPTTIALESCEFVSNSAVGSGGAVHGSGNTFNAQSHVTSCVFTNNTADADGGALVFKNMQMPIEYCTFTENSAGNNGGALAVLGDAGGDFDVRHSTFVSNTGATRAGAAFVSVLGPPSSDAFGTFFNSSFYCNGSPDVGAILVSSSDKTAELDVDMCTFSCNYGQEVGGPAAAVVADGGDVLVNITRSDFEANFATDSAGDYDAGKTTYPDDLIAHTDTTNSGTLNTFFTTLTIGDPRECTCSPIGCASSSPCQNGGKCSNPPAATAFFDPLSCNCSGAATAAGYPSGANCDETVCGDSIAAGSEDCDDGDFDDDDGCTSTCQSVCGDGYVVGEEVCDDGNSNGGDGCAADCRSFEAGFNCSVPPGSLCTPICGDGIVVLGETCDDANSVSGDGCESNCQTLCGDGFLVGPEGCDDNNTVSGDGCDGNCTNPEAGWACAVPGEPCAPVCGDGLLSGGEECDDGNVVDGDGCNSTCVRLVGWACPTPGLDCSPICGDGLLVGDEVCDDSNTNPGDGCAPDCAVVETGWDCSVVGAPCSHVCGDGFVRGIEACDDGNTAGSDGCSGNCLSIDLGYVCPTPNALCSTVCGDSLIVGAEVCDDGNSDAGDGCDATCSAVETGWNCTGIAPGLPCAAICGDGVIVSSSLEGCDDGNVADGDGCDALCALELGWQCLVPGFPCSTVCGDGVIVGTEVCDDGNALGGDGCNAVCNFIELGYECPAANISCNIDCGDLYVYPGEETCDDGNEVGGDGCSSSCEAETGFVCPSSPGGMCSTVCDDGIVAGSEACDDGNTVDFDGCSADCLSVETGWDCGSGGSACTTVCGDGLVVGDEDCDDGNTLGGDGCSANCTTTCGDGFTAGSESCDDGNTRDNDGCSSTCVTESGWNCTGSHGCVTICGDGTVAGNETCDDGNNVSGDGCTNSTCQTESGYECPTPGSLCSGTCGNGQVDGAEQCDDGNSNENDGCYNDCSTVCGDGIVAGSEECDDGNTINGDGCTSSCTAVCGDGIVAGDEDCDLGANNGVSAGCSVTCTTTCGDGVKLGNEGCDDGNAAAGDGCDSLCRVEDGWVCAVQNNPCESVCGDGIRTSAEECDDELDDGCVGCQSECGDGIVVGFEMCDDGNTADGDECSSDCLEVPEAIILGLNENDVIAVGSMGALFIVLGVAVLIMNQIFLTSRNADLVWLALALLDVGTDVAFIVTVWKEDDKTLFIASAICLGGGFLVNGFALFHFFGAEFRANKPVRDWMIDNTAAVTWMLFLSTTNLGVLRALDSKLFGLAAFSAPWSTTFSHKARVVGVVSNVVEDIPQFAIQLAAVMTLETVSTATYASIVVTLVVLLESVVSRVILYCAIDKDDDKKDATELQDEPESEYYEYTDFDHESEGTVTIEYYSEEEEDGINMPTREPPPLSSTHATSTTALLGGENDNDGTLKPLPTPTPTTTAATPNDDSSSYYYSSDGEVPPAKGVKSGGKGVNAAKRGVNVSASAGGGEVSDYYSYYD